MRNESAEVYPTDHVRDALIIAELIGVDADQVSRFIEGVASSNKATMCLALRTSKGNRYSLKGMSDFFDEMLPPGETRNRPWIEIVRP